MWYAESNIYSNTCILLRLLRLGLGRLIGNSINRSIWGYERAARVAISKIDYFRLLPSWCGVQVWHCLHAIYIACRQKIIWQEEINSSLFRLWTFFWKKLAIKGRNHQLPPENAKNNDVIMTEGIPARNRQTGHSQLRRLAVSKPYDVWFWYSAYSCIRWITFSIYIFLIEMNPNVLKQEGNPLCPRLCLFNTTWVVRH